MYICTLSELQVSEPPHVAQFSLRTQRQLCQYFKEREANFSGKLYSICLMCCKAWRYLDLCSVETWTKPTVIIQIER